MERTVKENLNNLMERIIIRHDPDRELKVVDFCKDWSATSNYKIVVPENGENNIVTLYMEYAKARCYKIKASRPFKNIEIGREFSIEEEIENDDKIDEMVEEISRFLFIDNLLFLNSKSANKFKENLIESMGEEFHIILSNTIYNEVDNQLSIYFEYRLDDEDYKTALICLTQRDCGDVYVETYTKNATRKESLRNKDILIDLIINDMSK